MVRNMVLNTSTASVSTSYYSM